MIETERLRLRDWREADIAPFIRHTNTEPVMRWLGGVKSEPEHRDIIRGRLMRWQSERGFTFWVVERKADGALLGRAGFMNPEGWPGCELGWVLDRAAWGQGYASEAMRLLFRFAFRELDYAKINLSVMADNTRAVALYERLGFQHEGRRRAQYYGAGRRWDELFMGLTRAEYEAQHAAWFPGE